MLNRYRITLWLGIICLLSSHQQASASLLFGTYDKEQAQVIASQRQLYLRTLDDVESGRSIDKALNELEGYPLRPYLQYRQLHRNISSRSDREIAQYLRDSDNPMLNRRLLSRWAYQLAKKQRWSRYRDVYREYDVASLNSETLDCHYAWSLYITNEKSEALQQAKGLWLHADSRPKACDQMFHVLQNENHIDSELAWKRFILAYDQKNFQLARYLTRFLDSSHKATAEKFLALYKTPVDLAKQHRHIELSPEDSALLYTLIQRMARQDLKQAKRFYLKNYHKLREQLSLYERIELATYFANRHVIDYYTDLPKFSRALKKADPEAFSRSTTLIEATIRAHLAQKSWKAAQETIALLPEDKRNSERWQYWQSRCAELLGDGDEIPMEAWQNLAQKRNYYGFLAAEHLQRPFSFEHVQSVPSEEDLLRISTMPGIRRALEHYVHNNISFARLEWAQVARDFSYDEHILAGHLAKRWGWHHQAILSTIRARSWDYLDIRFPKPYADATLREALKHNIPAEWIHATARQESAYATDARSSANARGLMQLLPSTAKSLLETPKSQFKTNDLYKPDINIQLGSKYLSQLHKRYEGNRALASAAYNAGPHRVQQWLDKSAKRIPLDVWIETIPFSETRQYVQNILSFSVIYKELYSDSPQYLLAAAERTVVPAHLLDN